MANTKKPTLKQKEAFKIMLDSIKSGNDMTMKSIMLKAGFSITTSKNPETNLTSKRSWQDMLAKIDNQEILNAFYEIMTDRENGKLKDKDAVIKAGKELATLKDLYPATKSKIVGLFDKISNLEE